MEANALEQRQSLPGLGLGLDSIVKNAGSAVTSGLGGVVGGLTSELGGITGPLTSDIAQGASSILSPILPTLTSTTESSSSSSSIATSTSDSLSSFSSSSVVFSSSSTTVSESITTPLADSGKQTVTNFLSVSATPSSTPPARATKGFLQNKPLAGFVFGAAGLVVVVLVFVITTWALRRRRRKNLIEDAISFDPSEPHYNDGLTEKRSSIGSDGLGGVSNVSHGTYNQHPASIRSNHGYYDGRPLQPPQQPYPRYPSPSQMGNQAYDGIGGNGTYYSSTARNVLSSNPPALYDVGLQPQANTTVRPSVLRQSPDEAPRGPALKAAN